MELATPSPSPNEAEAAPQWFCHKCRSTLSCRTETEDGELGCQQCQEIGFVEIVPPSGELPFTSPHPPPSPLMQQGGPSANELPAHGPSSDQPFSNHMPFPVFGNVAPRGIVAFPAFRSAMGAERVTAPPSGFRITFGDTSTRVHQDTAAIFDGDTVQTAILPLPSNSDIGAFMETLFNGLGAMGVSLGVNEIVQIIMEQNIPNQRGSPPTSAAVVASLPEERLDETTAVGDCAICQEDFIGGDQVTKLSLDPSVCSHMFHTTCVIPWLHQHNSCPVCRYELPTDDPEYERQRNLVRTRVEREMQRRQWEGATV